MSKTVASKSSKPPKVINVEIKTVEFLPELVTKDSAQLAKIRAVLPKKLPQKISFIIENTNSATVNALRRCVMSELPWKVLDVSPDHVVTTEPFLKVHEFCKRIAFIPVDQNVPMDTKLSFSIKNTDMNSNRMIVRSDVLNTKYCDTTYRIAELHPGFYLKVQDIGIKEGVSYKMDEPDGANAKYSPVSNVEFSQLTYTSVKMFNGKKQIYSAYVKTQDLAALIGKKNIDPLTLHNSRIVILGDAPDDFDDKHYDYAIKSKTPIETYQSTNSNCREFYMCVRTLGNIDPSELMRRVCDNLIERFMKLEKDITMETPVENIQMSMTPNELSTLKVIGEKHTLANMLVTTISELDPTIPLVNYNEDHILKYSFILSIIHPEPLKIIRDAIAKCISDLTVIRGSF